MKSISLRRAPVLAVAALLCACSTGQSIAPSPGLPAAPAHARPPLELVMRGPSANKIKHIIIVVQENRSFNNLFYGFPRARTAKYGYDTAGDKVQLLPIGLETTWDVDHSAKAFFAACNGTGSIPGTDCRMNGFDRENVGCGAGGGPPCPIKHPQYAYVPHSETKPYFEIGKQYVLADEMFASNFDASSFVSHQYIIAGQAESAVNYPYGAWGCPGGSSDTVAMVGPKRQLPDGYEVPCWNPTTLGDELDSAGISWAFYTSATGLGSLWSAYQAIKHIYDGPDWKNDVITPQTQFFDDVSKGRLRSVSWITPTCENSDHAGCGSKTGPSWVASLVNAVGQSKYWNSTAMFIFWDDYGGWYDSEPPAYADYDGLGLRLPMLVVSAYAKQGHVSHVHFEHGSILRFVEDTFGLPRLAASDARATSPAHDCFNFKKPPRAFVTIQSPYDKDYFEHQPLDLRSPDWE